MTEPYDTWRQELEASLKTVLAELAEDEAKHEQALLAVRSSNEQKISLAQAFARVAPRSLPGLLVSRKRGFEARLDEARGDLTRVTNSIVGHRRQIADIQEALELLHIISPSDDADASEAAD